MADKHEEAATQKMKTGMQGELLAFVKRYFAWAHLPDHVQHVSKEFGDVAVYLCDLAEGRELFSYDHEQLQIALQKLLEAKDAAVRALL